MALHELPDLLQGSEEWHDQRRGMVTASVVGRLISSTALSAIDYFCPDCDASSGAPCLSKTARNRNTPILTLHRSRTEVARNDDSPAPLKTADNDESRGLTATLVAERITGYTEPTFMNSDMYRGVACEPIARDLYSRHHAAVNEVGFMRRDEDGWSLGFSPDGLVGDDGLIEIKAPRAKTHFQTILADTVPAHYVAQCQAGLLVSGRKWLDFISYVGGMPLYVRRVYPDQQWFDAITEACIQFEKNAEVLGTAYEQRVRGLPVAERIDLEMVI